MSKKKINTLLVFLFIFLAFVLYFVFSINSRMLFKIKGDIAGVGSTSYKDWSRLTSVDNDYSYSTLIYTNSTKIYANMNPNDASEENKSSVKVSTSKLTNNKATPVITLYGLNSEAEIIITDCAIDQEGNKLSAVLKVRTIEKWLESKNARTKLSIDNIQIMNGTQNNPNIRNGYTKSQSGNNDLITFELATTYGLATAELTYYKDLKLKNVDEGRYTELYDRETVPGSIDYAEVDTDNSVIATNITKVNTFYNDIDITKNSTTTTSFSDKMFNGREGVAPLNGTTEIYYSGAGYSGEYSDIPYKGSTTYGVKLFKYEDQPNNIYGVYIGKNDFFEASDDETYPDLGLQGIFYATSASFLTSNLSGQYKFVYGGTNNGIWFSFFSPLGYDAEKPIKTTNKYNQENTMDDIDVFTTEKYTYHIEQYIPNNYYSSVIDYSTVYNNFTTDNYYSKLVFSDQIDSELTIYDDEITVTDINGTDLTNYFDISVNNNLVTATVNDNSLFSELSFYNNLIILNIPVSEDTVLENTKKYDNKGSTVTAIGNGNDNTEETNTVSVNIKSPKVIYDCQNGETSHETVYLNPNSNVDLSKVCTKQGSNHIGWVNAPTSREKINDLVIGTDDITIYALYEKNITVSTDDQIKVFDGDSLEANDNCSLKDGTLEQGHRVVCSNTGSITNVGTVDKIISEVRVLDSNDQDVTNLYAIAKENAKLTITPRNIVITTTNQEKVYDGTSLDSTNDCASAETKWTLICTNSGSITNVGTENKVIDSVSINYNNVDVTRNFNITKENAQLEITPKSIIVNTSNQTKVYDGTSLNATNDCTSTGLVSGDTIECINSGSITNVGTENKIINSVIISRGQDDVTDNYSITKNNGILEVTPKEILVTTTNQQKEYDGTPLVATNDCASVDLVNGHSTMCVNSGSITNKGVTDKVIETVEIKDSNLADVTSNYRITKQNGLLMIGNKVIVVKARNQEKEYDGAPLNADSTCDLVEGELEQGHTITCTNIGSITNVGTDTKTLQTVVIKDSNDQDVTDNYVVGKQNGLLEVTPKEIIVRTNNQAKAYDGTSLDADNNCMSDDLVLGDRLSCTNSGSIINRGVTNKVIDGVVIKNSSDQDITNNYIITKQNGTLTVTPKEILVTTTNQEKEYDGTSLDADNNCTSDGLISGHTLLCTNSGSIINVGTTSKIIETVGIKDSNLSDVSNNYLVTKQNGSLSVTPKQITVKATNQSKLYDRTPLNADDTCELINSTLPESESIMCTNSGSQTLVGSSPKSLDNAKVMKNNVDITSNYNVIKQNGVLRVYPLTSVITLDPKGGSEGTENIFEVCDDKIYLDTNLTKEMTINENPVTIPTRKGYVFKGYYTNSDGTGDKVIDENGFITNYLTPDVCQNRTIYAKWEPRKYTLTVIYNNGKDNDVYELDYEEEKNIDDPVKEGYTFTKWNLTGAGSSINDKVFKMGYEDAVIEANYTKTPDDCELVLYSKVYTINQANNVIDIKNDETIENIKKNVYSKGVINVEEKSITVSCGEKKRVYVINRYVIMKTGNERIKYGIIISAIISISVLLIFINKQRDKSEVLSKIEKE